MQNRLSQEGGRDFGMDKICDIMTMTTTLVRWYFSEFEGNEKCKTLGIQCRPKLLGACEGRGIGTKGENK